MRTQLTFVAGLAAFAAAVGHGRAAYGASKAGVVLLTKSVASPYGTPGIRCNTVAQGLTLTPGAVDNATPEYLEGSLALCPMPRLCAPEDVPNAVLFLASDEAAYINAATLMVDGGATVYLASTRMPSASSWERRRGSNGASRRSTSRA